MEKWQRHVQDVCSPAAADRWVMRREGIFFVFIFLQFHALPRTIDSKGDDDLVGVVHFIVAFPCSSSFTSLRMVGRMRI
jgi:hypothetical protein